MPPHELLGSEADPAVAIDPAEVARVVEEIFPEALAEWIHGSFPQSRARRGSDLDLAILPDRPLDGWKRIERAQDVAARLHREVDPVDPRRVSPVLRYEAVTRGICVVPAIPTPETCSRRPPSRCFSA